MNGAESVTTDNSDPMNMELTEEERIALEMHAIAQGAGAGPSILDPEPPVHSDDSDDESTIHDQQRPNPRADSRRNVPPQMPRAQYNEGAEGAARRDEPRRGNVTKAQFVDAFETLIYAAEDLGTQRDLARGMYSMANQQQPDRPVALAQAQILGEIPLVMHARPPKFEDKDDLPWEEFENALLGACRGRTEETKISLLQQSLGKGPQGWYNCQDLRTKPFETQLKEFRREYSRRDPDGRDELPTRIIMKPGETVHEFQTRIRRHFMYLIPILPVISPQDDPGKRAEMKLEFRFKVQKHDSDMRDMFIQGLPTLYHRKMLNLKKPPKTFREATEIAKKWHRADQKIKKSEAEYALMQTRQFNQELALNYLAAKGPQADSEDEDDEVDEDDTTPPFVYAAEFMQKNRRKPDQKEISATKSAEEHNEKVKREVAKQIEKEKKEKAAKEWAFQLGEMQTLLADISKKTDKVEESIAEKMDEQDKKFAERLQKMLTTDAKPTGKAGTKADPLTEDAEKEVRKRVRCDCCGRFGHWTADCRFRLGADQKNPVQGRNRGNPGQRNGNRNNRFNNDNNNRNNSGNNNRRNRDEDDGGKNQNNQQKGNGNNNKSGGKWQNNVVKTLETMESCLQKTNENVQQTAQVLQAMLKPDAKN